MLQKNVDGILKFQTKRMPDALRKCCWHKPQDNSIGTSIPLDGYTFVSLEGHYLQDPMMDIIFFMEEGLSISWKTKNMVQVLMGWAGVAINNVNLWCQPYRFANRNPMNLRLCEYHFVQLGFHLRFCLTRKVSLSTIYLWSLVFWYNIKFPCLVWDTKYQL